MYYISQQDLQDPVKRQQALMALLASEQNAVIGSGGISSLTLAQMSQADTPINEYEFVFDNSAGTNDAYGIIGDSRNDVLANTTHAKPNAGVGLRANVNANSGSFGMFTDTHFNLYTEGATIVKLRLEGKGFKQSQVRVFLYSGSLNVTNYGRQPYDIYTAPSHVTGVEPTIAELDLAAQGKMIVFDSRKHALTIPVQAGDVLKVTVSITATSAGFNLRPVQ